MWRLPRELRSVHSPIRQNNSEIVIVLNISNATLFRTMADQPVPTDPAPPPKPGDNVPAGGLDPTQVFAAPPAPPPPPPGAAQSAGSQGDGKAPPPAQPDSGKPPPPVGTRAGTDEEKKALKDQGYDDEDIRVLGVIGDYRFSSISQALTTDHISVPEHPETTFDAQQFLMLLAGSISLMRDEKWRIIQAIPKLSQFQIDELFKILNEEKKKFAELSPKHLLQLQKLEQKHSEEWKDLQSMMVQQNVKEQDTAQADEIRKQLGL